MKMGDGGFRPAFNVQLATTTDAARVIVGVEVTSGGSDMGQSPPMLDQIQKRTGKRPAEILIDGGYVDHASIDQVSRGARRSMALHRSPARVTPGIPTNPVPRTARRLPLGGSAWAPRRPSTPTANEPRRPKR